MNFPSTVALIASRSQFTQALEEGLAKQGVLLYGFTSHAEALAYPDCFSFPFYVLNSDNDQISTSAVVTVLRKRTAAGILVVTQEDETAVFQATVSAGADMVLQESRDTQRVILNIAAIYRRIGGVNQLANVWRIDCRGRALVAPDGVRVSLTKADMAMLRAFLEAPPDALISRHDLCDILGITQGSAEELLYASVYRLRRRVRKSTNLVFPINARSGSYAFHGTLALMP